MTKNITKELSSNSSGNYKLQLDDSRRLTGKGFDWDYCGAIIDCFISGIEKQTVVNCWQKQIDFLLAAVGWELEHTHSRIFEDGASFLISAPMDALYAATEINEAAWLLCCDELQDTQKSPKKAILVENLKQIIADEINPQILNWIQQAKINHVPCLIDDDEISLGYGASSQTWAVSQLPNLDSINWSQYQSIPIAMVTGTNGKSTTVRLTSEMIKAAGICCGITSTDFIKVGDEIIQEGDYSGPGGARILLRNSKTELALLEVARGGLLRRGLAVDEIDAALITNIAEDHFGEYGINNLDALTKAKCIVAKGLTSGTLILNADDVQLVKVSKTLNHNISWFSLDKNNPVLVEHRKSFAATCYLDSGKMVYQDQHQCIEVIDVKEVAMTFNGAAKHNIQNALGAIALAFTLNIDLAAIRYALKNFNSDSEDNPGRGNRYHLKGAEVILDFAHNTHSMNAMVETVKDMPANRKILMLSAAGDRSDKEIQEMTMAAMMMQPELLVIVEIEEYLRGREVSVIPQLIQKQALDLGQDPAKIMICKDSLTGAEAILDLLQSGDLALIMALTQRPEISKLLEQKIAIL
jgi:UDP-N-acetylmuramyl tripeptide synthase